ncbi:MAG: ThuA domain-containing protein [Pseudomonadales bacterium]
MTSVLVVSKGHDYDQTSFQTMLAELPDIEATLVEQPAAQIILQQPHIDAYDAVLFYDMSGIPGVGLTHDLADDQGQPDPAYRQAIERLLELGKGLVLLNHATVSWPHWPLWRTITGSSFMLSAGLLNGQHTPGSGYRGGHGPYPNPTLKLQPAGNHRVLEGLDKGFTITDEIYLKTSDFEANVVPLLRGEFDFVADNFTPPPLAPADEQANWQHPPGSDLIVWANAAGNSPVVVSDVGDGPPAYENPDYRRLLGNALHWVASAEARSWATAQTGNNNG